MTPALTDVRAVRPVRDMCGNRNKAETLAAVGMCGTCGQWPTCAPAHEADSRALLTAATTASRAYESPHIPHIPHMPTAARVSVIQHPAQLPAHPARSRAHAISSLCPAPEGMEGEGLW